MLQLEEYDTRRFVHWVALHVDQLAANPMLDLLGLLGVVVLFLPLESGSSEDVIACGLSIAVGLAGLLWERRLRERSPVKKALVMTPRARRLLACAAILSLGICLILLARQARLALAIAWLLPMLAPVILVISRMVMEPVEASIRDWYVRDALSLIHISEPTRLGM